MAEKAIDEVAPGFRQDQDEYWMPYLPDDKVVFMKNKRLKYLKIVENLDNLKRIFNHESRTQNWDEATKRAKTNVYKQTKTAFEKKTKSFLLDLVPKFQQFKDEALKAKDAAARSLHKRPRLEGDNEFVIDIESGFDLEEDRYLPRMSLPDQEPGSYKRKKSSTRPSQPTSDSPSTSAPPEPNPVKGLEIDPIMMTVDNDDWNIILKLKPLVNKYQCRDRVLRYIRSCRKQSKHERMLAQFNNYFDKLKQNRLKK